MTEDQNQPVEIEGAEAELAVEVPAAEPAVEVPEAAQSAEVAPELDAFPLTGEQHPAQDDAPEGEPSEPSSSAPAASDNADVPEATNCEAVLEDGTETNVPAVRVIDPATGVY